MLDGFRPGGVTAVYAKTSSVQVHLRPERGAPPGARRRAGDAHDGDADARAYGALLQLELGPNFRQLKYEPFCTSSSHRSRTWPGLSAVPDMGLHWPRDGHGDGGAAQSTEKNSVVFIDLIDHVSSVLVPVGG